MEKVNAIWHHRAMAQAERFPSDEADRFQVRMPPGLRERIAVAAERNNRSMNSEIVATLEKAFPPLPTQEELIAYAKNLIKSAQDEEKAQLFRDLLDMIESVDTPRSAPARPKRSKKIVITRQQGEK